MIKLNDFDKRLELSMTENYDSVVNNLIEMNLYLRFPVELSCVLPVNHTEPIQLMGLQNFKKYHRFNLVSSVDIMYSPYATLACIVDGVELFKITPILPHSLTYLVPVYVQITSKDGLPVVVNAGDIPKVLSTLREKAEEKEVSQTNTETLATNLYTLAHKFPWEVQKTQLIEEVGELLQAVSKYERANGIGQPTPVTPEEAMKNLIEEVAGVQVMLCEVIEMLNIKHRVKHEMLDQTNRTLERIKEREQKNENSHTR